MKNVLIHIIAVVLFCSTYFTGVGQIFSDTLVEAEKKHFRASLSGSKDAENFLTVASDNFNVNYYRCEWSVDPSVRFIKGKITSYFTFTALTDNIIFDLSDTLLVDSVTYKGAQVAFQRIPNDGLQILFPLTLQAGQLDSVSVYYKGVPRMNLGFEPFVQTTHDGVPVIWTLSEPYGAKEWWPCKNGLDDKADSIDIIITNPGIYQASSNGVMKGETVSSNLKTSLWKHRYPIASYLVAFSVTNFIVLKDTMMVGAKVMELVDYAYPEYKDYFESARPDTKYSLALYARLFEDYPFANEKYGFTQFAWGGGMEHQTNTFLVFPGISLITHESAHQWFGDKITCGSWQDIWLNEGFATYCEVLYYESLDKNLLYYDLNALGNAVTALPEGSVWIDDTTNANRIFNQRLTYYKGSYLVHMLRCRLGDESFFKGIKRYLNDPLLKYGFARTSDLQRNLEMESGKDLNSFFQKWFYGQGHPTYSVMWTVDSNNLIYVKINQSTSHPSVSFFDMPVPVEFKNKDHDTIMVFDHLRNGQTFLANPGFVPDTAIFDPLKSILSRNNTISKSTCDFIDKKDTLFPFYNVKWLLNTNNWCYLEIDQVNTKAVTDAENIPMYLHFSANGKDTSYLISNIRYKKNIWINIGFPATNVYISTSCLMDQNYTITKLAESSGHDEIRIFPVPVSDNNLNISLKNPSDKQLHVVILNASGQLAYKNHFDTPGKNELFSVPFNHLPKGVYVVRLESEIKIRITRKIMK